MEHLHQSEEWWQPIWAATLSSFPPERFLFTVSQEVLPLSAPMWGWVSQSSSISVSHWGRQAAKLIKMRARRIIVFLASCLSMTHSMHARVRTHLINQINTNHNMDTFPLICVGWMLHQILISPYAKDKCNSGEGEGEGLDNVDKLLI